MTPEVAIETILSWEEMNEENIEELCSDNNISIL